VSDDARPRHERVTAHPTPGDGNSLRGWWRRHNPLRIALQYAVIWIVRISPSLRLKRWLMRRLGATVEGGVTFALEATPDVFYPDLVTVCEDAVVGYQATILCHEYLQDEYRTGEVVVGERAMIGAGAVLLPGVEVGADAQVGANSVVTRDVPPGATVAGVPAEPIEREAGSGDDSDGIVHGGGCSNTGTTDAGSRNAGDADDEGSGRDGSPVDESTADSSSGDDLDAGAA
jgi:acetyltransferase-like isoleucine patch superfamily enzyme